MTENLIPAGPPDDWVELPEVGMSNYDGRIEPDFETALRTGPVWGAHSAWEFYGRVWFDGVHFHEQVWRYGAPVAHFMAASLEALRDAVNDEWGWR
jgi:hypothetical protein